MRLSLPPLTQSLPLNYGGLHRTKFYYRTKPTKNMFEISLEVEIVTVHIKHRTPHDFSHNEIKIAILLSNERLPCRARKFATNKHFCKHQTESIHEKFIRRSEDYETSYDKNTLTVFESTSQPNFLG